MNQPFLPEPENAPVPAATQKKNGVRTLLLWVALIVMFLGVWQFLTPNDKNHDGATHERTPAVAEAKPCKEDSGIPW